MCSPCAGLLPTVKLHVPSPRTVVLPSVWPPSLMLTTAPGRPVPSSVGLLSLLTPPGATSPTNGSVLSTTRTMLTGWALVLMVTGNVPAALALPAGSLAVTLRVCAPSLSGCTGVMLHLPSRSTTALPMTLSPSLSVMVSPAVAPSPAKVGVASSVVPLAATVPLSAPTLSVTVKLGVSGAAVSITTRCAPLSGPRAVAPSNTRAVRSFWPSPSVLVVTLHWPSASMVAEPTSAPCAYTRTTLPAAPVPRTSSWRSSVLAPWATSPCTAPTLSTTAVIAATCEPSAVTVKFSAALLAPSLPAASTPATLQLCACACSAASGVKLQSPLPSTVAVPITAAPL